MQVEKLERRESMISNQSEGERSSSSGAGGGGAESEFDADAIVQEARPELEDYKPKLKGRKFDVLPMQNKDTELSSLCSIM